MENSEKLKEYLQSVLEMMKIDSNLHEKEEKINYEKKKVNQFNVGGHLDQSVTFFYIKNLQ